MDDFGDGDLLNPEWQGDTDKFTVADGRLRLMDASRSGPATLSVNTPVTAEADTLVYSFLVEMDFSPSASNFSSIRLNEGGPANGEVFSGVELRFGGISGDQDALTATFSQGGSVQLGEIMGTPGALGSQPAIVRFRLRRESGIWSLDADYSGGTEYVLQGSLTEPNDLAPDFFEIECRYTSTRSDKFSFDDLNVASLGVPTDETPPSLDGARVQSATEIILDFSEPVLAASLEDPANYTFSVPGLAVTSAAIFGTSARLTLDAALPLRESVTITVGAFSDEAGNVTNNATATVFYDPTVSPTPANVQITEFMADPNPVVGLPEAEYVELHNPTAEAVSLTGVGIASGGSPVIIGEERIAGGGYVVLVEAADAPAFRDLGVEVIVINLPGLSNAGDEILLTFSRDTLQLVNYTDDWYNDPERDNGGYSIEFTGGADAGCSGRWRASVDAAGGTPGRENSVLNDPADVAGPRVIGTEIDPDGITVIFDEPVSPPVLTYALEGPVSSPGATALDGGTTFRINFSAEIEIGQLYVLTIPGTFDCVGNQGEERQFRLALPEDPEVGDIVINEILFNPVSGGSDFLELFNCSDKVFQVQGWTLLNEQSTSSTTASREITASRLFLPGEYLTFTDDPDDLELRYQQVDPNQLVEQRLPSLPNDEGNISVIADGIFLDAFDYTDDLHSDLLDSDDGVSLERVRIKAATQSDANWYTAAASEGFGTPTRPNSQNRDELAPAGDQVFSLINTTFSPDGDSNEDFLELSYLTPSPGFLARVRIFDAQGRLVRTLRRVELLAGEGTILWDGADDDGARARTGLYVLYVELFAPGEQTTEEKLVAVLAGGL